MGAEFTTISVTPELRDDLRAMKRGQESYAELLERLIEDGAETDP